MPAPTPPTNPLNVGSSISTTDIRQSGPENNKFLPDVGLAATDANRYSSKALTESLKNLTNVNEKYEIAIIVSDTVGQRPQTARNSFIKNNFPNTQFPTEYKILRAPLELEDINLSSDVNDLSKWCSMEFASVSKTLSGTKLSPGTAVMIMRETDQGEFHIIDVLSDGGFVPNSPKTASTTPFKQRTCRPPPVGGSSSSINLPETTSFCPDVVKALVDKQPLTLSERDKRNLDRLSPGFKEKLIKFLFDAYQKGYFPAAWENTSNPLAAENFRSYIQSGSRTLEDQRRANPFMSDPSNSLHTKGLAVDLHFRKIMPDGSIRKLPNFEDESDWTAEDDGFWNELAGIATTYGIESGHKAFKFRNARGNMVRDSVHFQSKTDPAIEVK